MAAEALRQLLPRLAEAFGGAIRALDVLDVQRLPAGADGHVLIATGAPLLCHGSENFFYWMFAWIIAAANHYASKPSKRRPPSALPASDPEGGYCGGSGRAARRGRPAGRHRGAAEFPGTERRGCRGATCGDCGAWNAPVCVYLEQIWELESEWE